jgi:hypothetical protein
MSRAQLSHVPVSDTDRGGAARAVEIKGLLTAISACHDRTWLSARREDMSKPALDVSGGER